MKIKSALLSLLSFVLAVSFSEAQGITPNQLDSLVNRAMQTFNVPGIAVAIVKDGYQVCSKGYGLRSLNGNQRTDGNTLFGIASNSKAFTTAALSILVDEGKLKWEDHLTKFLPEFKMYDSCVTKQFTICDMLTHRSGLGVGAGDLLHNPDSSDFTIKDIINSLQYLKPEASFRSRYAYDNIFYLVAAEVVKRVSGMSWQDFIEKQIFLPLQMTNSRASYQRINDNLNKIDGYMEVNGKLEAIVTSSDEADAGAGGIYSSAADMSKWMLMQLNHGRYGAGNNNQLFSNSVQADMWTPQIFIPVSKNNSYNTHFGAYGLGWFLTDVRGYENVWHTGQDNGMISEVSLIPDLNLGITVLSNQEGGGAVKAIIDQVIDSYVGVIGIDRVTQWSAKLKVNNSSSDSAGEAIWKKILNNVKEKKRVINAGRYTGVYHDSWFGDVDIKETNGQLRFQSRRSLQLKGDMNLYSDNVFLVRWNNPQIKADALVTFITNAEGNPKGFTIRRASPSTSFAYDFQDLNFVKITK